jgi:hypothetical protein
VRRREWCLTAGAQHLNSGSAWLSLSRGCIPTRTLTAPPCSSLNIADTSVARTWEHSLWDTFRFSSPLTLGELVNWFQKSFALEVVMVSYGAAVLFTDLAMNAARQEQRKAMRCAPSPAHSILTAPLLLHACVQAAPLTSSQAYFSPLP